MRTLFVALVLGLVAPAASAATVEVKSAWIRTPPPGAPTAAGYADLTNRGISSDRLLSATSSAAASVVPHHMSMAGGIMRMSPMTGGLAIGASATARFAPNGDHLMLIGLKAPLRAGQHVKIVLRFQRAGNVAADFTVRDVAPGGGMVGMRM